MHIPSPLLALLNLGPWEIGGILAVVLLLFGAKRLPELARSMGKSLREFKKATSDVEDNFRAAMEEEERKKNLPPPGPVTRPADATPEKPA